MKDLMDRGLGQSQITSPELMREADQFIDSMTSASILFTETPKRKQRSPLDSQPIEKRQQKSVQIELTNYFAPLAQND